MASNCDSEKKTEKYGYSTSIISFLWLYWIVYLNYNLHRCFLQPDITIVHLPSKRLTKGATSPSSHRPKLNCEFPRAKWLRLCRCFWRFVEERTRSARLVVFELNWLQNKAAIKHMKVWTDLYSKRMRNRLQAEMGSVLKWIRMLGWLDGLSWFYRFCMILHDFVMFQVSKT